MSVRVGHDRSAFTIVEVVVVIILLSVAVGLVVPRLVRRDVRARERIAQRVQDLLRSASRRSLHGGEVLRLRYDSQDQELGVLSMVRDEGFCQSWNQQVRWRVDPLIPPVALAPLRVTEARVDTARVRTQSWMLELGSSGGFTTLVLALDDESPAPAWHVLLDTRAGLVLRRRGGEPPVEGMIDLDAIGMRDTPW